MEFVKKVQFLGKKVYDSGLRSYDFLDIESNLPFTCYSSSDVSSTSKLQEYSVYDLKFNLLRANDPKHGLCWKIKLI